ncbi:hypothetical protein [Halobacterium sp. CBA1126]|uniref:hypothetical protein n=1 Tax=Halobacterium sp. CBA1126 TaxID=2668074 RepID=UPI0012FB7EFB|nr:hypothetical protein [Halobacterium sp. CBA1126]MUV61766.1 hypothetical protein [Halobacterium sp. CBA1126]
MNLNRCSKLAVALVVVLATAAVPAAAVSVSGDTPDSVEVDASQNLTYEVTDLYTDYDQWTLQGQTELTGVSWTVTLYDQTGAQIDRLTYNGQSFEQSIEASEDVNSVTVRLEGTVPAVESYSYDPAQSMTLASFAQVQEGGTSTTLTTYETRPYTQASDEARTAIGDAQDAIENAQNQGASVSGAEGDLEDAIEFYNSGNFEQAVSNAEEAESAANSAASSAERTDLIIMVGAALVVLLLIAGGVYWYLQQRDTYDKLG